MSPADPLSTAAWLAGVLETLGIRYIVGGSVAGVATLLRGAFSESE